MRDRGYGRRSANGFTRMMAAAWARGKGHAAEMAKDCKCECRSITLELRLASDDRDNRNLIRRYSRSEYAMNIALNFISATIAGGVSDYPPAGFSYEYPCKKNAKP